MSVISLPIDALIIMIIIYLCPVVSVVVLQYLMKMVGMLTQPNIHSIFSSLVLVYFIVHSNIIVFIMQHY